MLLLFWLTQFCYSNSNLDHKNPINLNNKTLKVGVYIEGLDNIEGDPNYTFNIDFKLWTIWEGDPLKNPSNKLSILNYDLNTASYSTYLNKIATKKYNGKVYTLFQGHGTVIKKFNFAKYPFDSHRLTVEIGFKDIFKKLHFEVIKQHNYISPLLDLDGFIFQNFNIYKDIVSYNTDFSQNIFNTNKSQSKIFTQKVISFFIDIKRSSGAFLIANFIGYFIGFALNILILLHPSLSRDDLFLASILVGASNYIYLVSILSISSLGGFVGSLLSKKSLFLILFIIMYIQKNTIIIDIKILNIL